MAAIHATQEAVAGGSGVEGLLGTQVELKDSPKILIRPCLKTMSKKQEYI